MRVITPEAERELGVLHPVLDKGEVILVDYLGGDSRVVDAARTSYTTGTKAISEDRALIHHLMRNAHTSPFEQVILVFRLKLPLFVAAHFVRHRTARLNAESFRFSEASDEFYMPAALRNQDTINKQGSLEAPFTGRPCPTCEGQGAYFTDTPEPLMLMCGACDDAGNFPEARGLDLIAAATRESFMRYEELIKGGVSRELARVILPQNLYTHWYWQIDLHNLFHFLRLRMDWHTQYESRQYALAMATIAAKVAPLCYEAFEEHVLFGARFSRSEMAAIRDMLSSPFNDAAAVLEERAAMRGIPARHIPDLSRRLLGEGAHASS